MEPQLVLDLKVRGQRGGKRKGAGRPKTSWAVPHQKRAEHKKRFPVHITLRVLDAVGNLREVRRFCAVREALRAGSDRFGFRLSEFSVQRNHLHLICEAEGHVALRRGIQGLAIRVAKAINALLARKGRVFSDRHHVCTLRSPTQTRFCLAYVVLNHRKHAHQNGATLKTAYADPCSTGAEFRGWITPIVCALRVEPIGLPRAQTWLLREGWKRAGLISPSEIPSA